MNAENFWGVMDILFFFLEDIRPGTEGKIETESRLGVGTPWAVKTCVAKKRVEVRRETDSIKETKNRPTKSSKLWLKKVLCKGLRVGRGTSRRSYTSYANVS